MLTSEVSAAVKRVSPIVALESTVITHGLPRPQNLTLARQMEIEVRNAGAVPATIAVLNGQIHVGLTDEELENLAGLQNPLKIGARDFTAAILKKRSGGTTVAGTLVAAHRVGIAILATGGIGGVHRGLMYDVSQDLRLMAETPMFVICSGAKAILDIGATLEVLETLGVPVVGYQTSEFPAFYSLESGFPVGIRLETPTEAADFARIHWASGFHSAILVANPIPKDDAVEQSRIEPLIENAIEIAKRRNIQGPALTPFLLEILNGANGAELLKANLSLLLNNARLAGQIAVALAKGSKNRYA